MSVETIRPEEVKQKLDSDESITLIDVRTPAEFQEIHVTIAENHPLDQLALDYLRELSADNEKTLYIICKSGSRGKMACEKLHANGITNVLNVDGGTAAWEACGYEVVRGKKVISLERQVRIAAGGLVLVGVVAGAMVHPGFLGLSAFVGAGLMFAGITDTCGMAMILARMPWNQLTRTTCSRGGARA